MVATAKDYRGFSPLHSAIAAGTNSIGTVQALVEGCDVVMASIAGDLPDDESTVNANGNNNGNPNGNATANGGGDSVGDGGSFDDSFMDSDAMIPPPLPRYSNKHCS